MGEQAKHVPSGRGLALTAREMKRVEKHIRPHPETAEERKRRLRAIRKGRHG